MSGESDFEFREGGEGLLMGNPDPTTAYSALPKVARIVPGGQPWEVALELESGEWVDLSPGYIRWATLHPSSSAGPVVMVSWAPGDDMAYAVPAELLPELLPYFPSAEDLLREGVQPFLPAA